MSVQSVFYHFWLLLFFSELLTVQSFYEKLFFLGPSRNAPHSSIRLLVLFVMLLFNKYSLRDVADALTPEQS